MNFFRTFFFALAALWTFTVGADPVWQTYNSTAAGYSVDMPIPVKESVKDLEKPGEKIYTASVSYGKGAFVVSVSDMNPDRLSKGAEANLDFLRDVSLKALGAKANNEKSEKVGQYPARRFDHSGGSYSGTTRIILVNRHIYQMYALGPDGYAQTPEALRFLNSFALTGK